MLFGVNVPIFSEYSDARYLSELARDAERSGWDGFFVWDHMATPWGDLVCDPWVALTAAAMVTERIAIGPMVTPIPRRRPWKLARETATLDRLSGGRLILGVGLGAFEEPEFANLGEVTDLKQRAEMLDEGLSVLTGLWQSKYDEPFSFGGKHYTVKDARFGPPPVRSPRIPIWVAANLPKRAPLRRAARWDGVFPMKMEGENIGMVTPEDVREIKQYIGEFRDPAEPFDIVIGGPTSGENTREDTDKIAAYEEAGLTWWHEGITPDRWSSWVPPWPVEQMRERILQGPPRVS